jgi:hypothetical protein
MAQRDYKRILQGLLTGFLAEVALLSLIQEAFINGGIDEEDRAAGKEFGGRRALGLSGLGDNQGVR